ncbi:hypothetical protein G7007_20855 [Pseudomonas entomophila]|jgi:hypothetical protein|uniref:hypothetical protein n=1 Tax=Pseudomonas entomophila TaxID=312306 RepID=UPI0015E3299D|nr:hypothetical protein [Pseudomonas entomophila]MBA1195277.1 hypothetical protein [Pseudomonas entomophila]
MTIKIKEAVAGAIENVLELFSEQRISGVLLEEVARDGQDNFLITIGFERPTTKTGAQSLVGGLAAMMATQRVYKVVCVDRDNGDVISIKDRALERQ